MAARTLEGKIAIVTGGSSSIGRAICLAYAQQGAKVIVADIREDSRDPVEVGATHEVVNKSGGEAHFRHVDVTDEQSVKDLIQEAVTRYGRLDIMVNNAGIAMEPSLGPHRFWDMPVEAFDKSVAVNGRGMWLGCKYALAQMVKQDALPPAGGVTPGRGWIINMASIMSYIATPLSSAYSVSKNLALGITRAAALDGAEHDIRVNAICPGYIDTTLTKESWKRIPDVRRAVEMKHPLSGGRFGVPDDIVPMAVFLAGEGARWMTGSSYTIDGGYTAQ